MNSFAHGFAVLCEIDQWKTSLAFVDIWHHSQSHCDVIWQFSKSQPTESIITSTWYCTLGHIHSLCEWREVIAALKAFYSSRNDLSLPSPLTDCKKFNLTDALLIVILFSCINLTSSGVECAKAFFSFLSPRHAALRRVLDKIRLTKKNMWPIWPLLYFTSEKNGSFEGNFRSRGRKNALKSNSSWNECCFSLWLHQT